MIKANPCAEGGKLYQSTQVEKIWTDEHVERFLDVASPDTRMAMMMAKNTGQRQGDLSRR
jgi:hypothetical protein